MFFMLTKFQFNYLYSLYKKGRASKEQIEKLAPYKVSNAIILAAGTSSRFAPLSWEKPKGLLKVRGQILIEREIEQLKTSGINDITIVVGYLKEQFFYLKEKYNVNIVINDDYNIYNNTSSLIRVLDKLSNTYICSSDNYFTENVFSPYVYCSFYSTVYAKGKTQEWCVKTDLNKKIKKVQIGGKASWYMLGHVYWNNSFSQKFKTLLETEYHNQKTKENLWEYLYIDHIKELALYAKHYDSNKVLEFDSLEELRLFDTEYINNPDCKILTNIAKDLNCQVQDIVNVKALKETDEKLRFSYWVDNKEYIYTKD